MPIAQVVNNSGALFHEVGIGGVRFSENLNICADGCSTPFKKVRWGTNAITVQMTAASSPVALGNLGVFKPGVKYAVNMIRGGSSMCAELSSRKNTDQVFNAGKSKKRIGAVCRSLSSLGADEKVEGVLPAAFIKGLEEKNSLGVSRGQAAAIALQTGCTREKY